VKRSKPFGENVAAKKGKGQEIPEGVEKICEEQGTDDTDVHERVARATAKKKDREGKSPAPGPVDSEEYVTGGRAKRQCAERICLDADRPREGMVGGSSRRDARNH